MILDRIASTARSRVEAAKKDVPAESMITMAEAKNPQKPSFTNALRQPGLSLICELKRASPSKGMISPEYPYMDICNDYVRNGAAAISVLTEPQYFHGSHSHLQNVAAAVDVPVLRKDFIIDDYQIYESKVLGASAVLLICGLLDQQTLVRFLDIVKGLGMDALVEAHNEEEVIRAVDSKAEVIGVNNRNLNDFKVDMGASARLRGLIPSDRLFVSESGIRRPEDSRRARDMGADAILVGEALMTSTNRGRMMDMLRGVDHD